MTMTKICLAMVASFAVSSCGDAVAETPEQCIERFAEHVALAPEMARAQIFFTYDVTEAELSAEQMGEAKRLTMAQGNANQAVEAFYANEEKIGPAILAADGLTLYRAAPIEGTPASSIDAGCEPPFEDARLVRVDWHAIQLATEDSE